MRKAKASKPIIERHSHFTRELQEQCCCGDCMLMLMKHDANVSEAISLRLVGICFIILALYVTQDSIRSLLNREAPDESLVGIILAAVSLVVMPLLVRAKRKVSRS